MGCHFLLQGIFPSQGLKLGLQHCRQIFYRLEPSGKPSYSVSDLKAFLPSESSSSQIHTVFSLERPRSHHRWGESATVGTGGGDPLREDGSPVCCQGPPPLAAEDAGLPLRDRWAPGLSLSPKVTRKILSLPPHPFPIKN